MQPGARYDEVTLTVANGDTASDWQEIGNPAEIGLLVPTITSGTVTVQVSNDGSTARGLVNQAGTAILVLAASTGAYAVSSNEMGACLGYKYIRVVCGASQGAQRLFKVTRKVPAYHQFI